MAACVNDDMTEDLARNIRAVVAGAADPDMVTKEVAVVLRDWLASGATLDAAVTVPNSDHYVMYPLHVAPDGAFCIASAVWDVAQKTPIHDHGVWGVVGIYQGMEREVHYKAGSHGGRLEESERNVWSRGEVTVCCGGERDIHQVSCASDVPCVGIHVYGGDIGRIKRRSYDLETGAATFFVSAWASPAS